MTESSSAPLSRWRIAAVFFCHAASQGGMFTRIPDLQVALHLSNAELGLALLGQPAGAILSFLFASRLVERFGTRLSILVSVPAMAFALLSVALAPNLIGMAIGLALFGSVFALSNIAINVEADRVEAATGRRLMNTCHGIWSVGLLLSSLLGVAMRGLGVPPALHFAAVAVPVLAGILIVVLPMIMAPARPHAGTTRRRGFAVPTVMVLFLLGYSVASSFAEGGLRNWSVIFMRDNFAAPDWVDTLTLPIFMAAQAIGRLSGDAAVTRWGPVRLARALVVTAIVGLVLIVVSPSLPLAMAGFALLGAGVCVSFPLSTSAAARLTDRPSSENVAALTMSQQILLLGAPALLGLVADSFSIRAAFAIMIPPLLLAFYLARYLGDRPVVTEVRTKVAG